MNKILSVAFALMLCMILALSAGCTQQQPAPQVTPTPAPEITSVATAATAASQTAADVSTTPGPTQSLPEMWSIEVQSNGESIDPQISTTFRGGKGQNLIPQLDIRITRSDGVVETGTMTQPFTVGKTVTLAGTRKNTDRAEVWAVTPNGDKVKIFDQYIPFRTFN
ncbi:hypothetical protein [uncultured Methanoregula sp.]|uniref:hypothetical protein n=1 Tax=uncultured Methanoregula sp. TaxID=1005933 RepID=UPI002AABF040|nr:hypothetical protein [uncultured Methanoregula sp.]